jgi:predicted ester cyclase
MVDKDRVVRISTMTGTNKGGFMDLPSTGDRVSVPVVLIFTLKNGKIVEEQRVYDFTGMLVQADVLKAKPL